MDGTGSRIGPGFGRVMTAALCGNLFEWYDFAVYGYMAAFIGKAFFPSTDEVASLLATFAVFGVGFLARPLGGILIGRLGDRLGRKAALVLTVCLMAAGTGLIGVIPGYATIGIAAPLLVLVARLTQGLSVGGEWGNSAAFIVEWAPPHRRGFFGSFQSVTASGGLLVGSGVAALFNTFIAPADMAAWGWRLPFLLGSLLGPFGLYLRRSIEDSPAFRHAQAEPTPPPRPGDPTALLLAARAFGFAMVWTVATYIFLVYMATFTAKYSGLSTQQALWSNTLSGLLAMVAVPFAGALSDRIGRRPQLLSACAGFFVLPYPLFSFLLTGPGFWGVLGVQCICDLVLALFLGAATVTIAEIFPTRVRTTLMSSAYALCTAVFGGFAPFLATWMIQATGAPVAPVLYVMLAAAVSGTVIFRLRESAHAPLR